MRLLLYSLIIYLIQILGEINLRLFPWEVRWTRNDRPCYSDYEEYEGFGKVCHIACCDCGASHIYWKANKGIYGVPIRPDGYNYKPRLKDDPSLANEEAKSKWNTNR